jgi:hypothetical protein
MFFLPVELAEEMNAASSSIKSVANVSFVISIKLSRGIKNPFRFAPFAHASG